MRYLIFTSALVLSRAALAILGVREVLVEDGQQISPWFTGPLLASSEHVVPVGYANIEPYFYLLDTYKKYDNDWEEHNVPQFTVAQPQLALQIGLTPWMDFNIFPTLSEQFSRNRSSFHSADLPTKVDFQLLFDKPGKWWPAIKLGLGEVFPSGAYQKLDPNKRGTDATGGGSYQSSIGLFLGRLWYLGGVYFFRMRMQGVYTYPAPVHVHGINAYGGAPDTHGTVRPGKNFGAIWAFELSLSRNWVLSLDVFNSYTGKTRFRGKSSAPNTAPHSNQTSLAPAIEYGFNDRVGVIAGAWFVFAGKNAGKFAGFVWAINWYTPWKAEEPTAPPRYRLNESLPWYKPSPTLPK